MGGYLSVNEADKKKMLSAIGVESEMDLYKDIPEYLLLGRKLNIPSGMSEQEVLGKLKKIAAKNKVYPTIFRGAGAYRHYIPSIVGEVTAKETFLTAYTPYQAEISQGVLQSIFEYQTMISELTGFPVSNASVYDGATAAAEAAAMCRDKKHVRTLVSAAAHPDVIRVMKTYAWAHGASIELVPTKDGVTDLDALSSMMDSTVGSVYIASPNYYGQIEDVSKAAEIVHASASKLIQGVNPIAAVLLKTPAESGADIAVGEGQPLGMPLSWGGPYLGFMAASDSMMRKLPGRIVGETTDGKGHRCFVLTLQAREQHIRREKASSNICSNEALCAMTAAVYLAAMGPDGMKEVAGQCTSKAHYFADRLASVGFKRTYPGEFFHEFVTDTPVPSSTVEIALDRADILSGLPLDDSHILWCATEVNTKDEMDRAAELLKEVTQR